MLRVCPRIHEDTPYNIRPYNIRPHAIRPTQYPLHFNFLFRNSYTYNAVPLISSHSTAQ